MEDFDDVDPYYIKGFNEGYILAQHKPELAQLLASVDSDSSRVLGLKAGVEQYQTEQIYEQQTQAKQPDVFDQLLKKQNQLEEWNRISPDAAPGQPQTNEKDLFEQLKQKQQNGHDGHTPER